MRTTVEPHLAMKIPSSLLYLTAFVNCSVNSSNADERRRGWGNKKVEEDEVLKVHISADRLAGAMDGGTGLQRLVCRSTIERVLAQVAQRQERPPRSVACGLTTRLCQPWPRRSSCWFVLAPGGWRLGLVGSAHQSGQGLALSLTLTD